MGQTEKQKRNWDKLCEDYIRDVMGGMPQCYFCRHEHGDNTCDAFPDGIPLNIVVSTFVHSKPYHGDKGIRFEWKKGKIEVDLLPECLRRKWATDRKTRNRKKTKE